MTRYIKIKDKLFYWSLALVFITLPFPKYDLNSQSIILCVICWLFYSSFREKWNTLKGNIPYFLILSSLFWVTFFGMLYTQNLEEGRENLQKSLPFLFFPLILFSVHFEKRNISLLLKYFSWSVVLASLLALIKAFYFKFNNLGDYFYYTELSILLDKHTTYFALFVVVAITFFINGILNKEEKALIKYMPPILFLSGMLYLLSVRVSIACLIIVAGILVFAHREKIGKTYFLLFLFAVLLTGSLYITPNFQKRFNAATPDGAEISDVYSRKVHWEGVMNTISNNNLLLGSGTGDGYEGLFEEYKKLGFQTGYKNGYNAHNQFLETTLFHGLIGLALLLLIIITVLKRCVRERDFFGGAIVLAMLLFMMTESTLARQSGIVLFSLLMTLFSIKKTIGYPPSEDSNISI